MATIPHSVHVPHPGFIPDMALDVLEAGVPLDTLTAFSESSGLKLAEVCEVVIPLRTLKHRRARKERLSLDESDKLVRLIRIYQQTLAVFANADKALWWMREPQHDFAGRSPLQMIRTDVGGRLAEEMLVQIDEGMFA